ncbi:MAG TPA: hypothetical protein VK190_04930 [Pseudoneobacillus sp.]|nr:hypothetical protein [Pseudoneobacillus sp.]
MYGYIYLTTNMINGKMYIGQKKNDKYWNSYLGSGILLKKAIKKYGKENFIKIILCKTYNAKDANKKEKFYINFFDAVNSKIFYNVAEGGYGSSVAGYDEERLKAFKEKMSKSQKNKKFPPNHGRNISKALKGKTHKGVKCAIYKNDSLICEFDRFADLVKYYHKNFSKFGYSKTYKDIRKHIKEGTEYNGYRFRNNK